MLFNRHVLFIIQSTCSLLDILQHLTTNTTKKVDLLTGTSFLKLTPVGLVTVTVLATVVVVGGGYHSANLASRGAFAGTWAWAWA